MNSEHQPTTHNHNHNHTTTQPSPPTINPTSPSTPSLPFPPLPVVHTYYIHPLVELPLPLSLGPLVLYLSGEFWSSPDSDIDPQNLRSWPKASAPLRPRRISHLNFLRLAHECGKTNLICQRQRAKGRQITARYFGGLASARVPAHCHKRGKGCVVRPTSALPAALQLPPPSMLDTS
jgi:hypothetical protein